MIEKYESKIQHWLESQVESASDDQLFAAGYLQGHVAVVLSELESQTDQSLTQLDSLMNQALRNAAQELQQHDQTLVNRAWQSLLQTLHD